MVVEHDVPLTALGLDSMAAVELMGRLETDLGLAPSLSDLLAGATLEDLIRRTLAPVEDEPALRADSLPEEGSRPVPLGQQALWLLEGLQPGNPGLCPGARGLRELQSWKGLCDLQ